MASRFVKAQCPTCGKFISIRSDEEADNCGTVVNHKDLRTGTWCIGGFGLPLPGEFGYKPFVRAEPAPAPSKETGK